MSSSVLQSPAGPQHPRSKGVGLLWSLLRCGVPVCWTRLGPEHLLPGGGGWFWATREVDYPGDGAPHRAEFSGHGVAL